MCPKSTNLRTGVQLIYNMHWILFLVYLDLKYCIDKVISSSEPTVIFSFYNYFVNKIGVCHCPNSVFALKCHAMYKVNSGF